MDDYRDFPGEIHVIHDHDASDQTLVRVDDSEETWPEMTEEQKKDLTFKYRLDGLIVASETMKIGKNSKKKPHFKKST